MNTITSTLGRGESIVFDYEGDYIIIKDERGNKLGKHRRQTRKIMAIDKIKRQPFYKGDCDERSM